MALSWKRRLALILLPVATVGVGVLMFRWTVGHPDTPKDWIWWCAVALFGVAMALMVVDRRQHRRAGRASPRYFAAFVLVWTSFMFIIGAELVMANQRFAMVLLAAGVVVLAIAAVHVTRYARYVRDARRAMGA